MIYLNNAEKTLYKPAVKNFSPVSAQDVKLLIAKIFGIKEPEHIYFGRSGSEVAEAALRLFLKPENGSCHVIVTDAEEADVYRLLGEMGAEVSVLKSSPQGRPDCSKLEDLIRPETRAIVCTHGAGVTGNVADLEQICVIARRHHLPVISDGRFTAGAIEVNLESLGADAYFFTGEKMLMGPEGIGVLYVKGGAASRKVSGEGAANLEISECGAASRKVSAGSDGITESLPEPQRLMMFYAALEFVESKGVYGIAMLTHRLAKRFFESAKAMDGVTVRGDFSTGDRLPTVAVTAEGFSAEEIRDYMKARGIIISAEQETARFSFGYFNTRPQVKETVQCLMDMLGIDDPYLLP